MNSVTGWSKVIRCDLFSSFEGDVNIIVKEIGGILLSLRLRLGGCGKHEAQCDHLTFALTSVQNST